MVGLGDRLRAWTPIGMIQRAMRQVIPSAHPAEGRRPLVQRRYSTELSDEDLCAKRWENPPPGHLQAMLEAVVNIEFFKGYHFTQRSTLVHTSTNNLSVRIPSQSKTQKHVLNIANRVIRDLVSMRTKAVPNVSAEPTTYNERDKAAARVAKYLLREFTESHEFALVRERLAQATELTGIGVLYPYYDPSAGEPLVIPEFTGEEDEEGNPVFATDETGRPRFWQMHEGRIRLDVGDIFSMRWDASQEDPHEAFWAMFGRVWHVELARLRFNLPDLEPDQDLNYADIMAHAHPWHLMAQSGGGWFEDSYVFIREYFERPSIKYPEGRYIVFSGKSRPTKEIETRNPYGNTLPFTWFKCIPVSGSPYGMTTLRMLRMANRAIDKRISSWIDDANILGRPKVLISRNANIEMRSLGNDEVQVLEYDPILQQAGKPEFMVPPPMPSWVTGIITMLTQYIDQISGMTDILRGLNPPGARSGTMLSHMMEQSHSLFFPMFVAIEAGYERVCQHVLRLAQEFYAVPRIIRCSGQDMEDEIILFTAADLQGSVDVKATAGSAAPKSRSLRLQMLAELAQMGAINQADFKHLAEFALPEEANEDNRITERLVRWEHRLMLRQGIPLLPGEQNDHWYHLKLHNRIRNRPEWFELDQAVREIFEQHCQAHQDFLRREFADISGGDTLAAPGTIQRVMTPAGRQAGS